MLRQEMKNEQIALERLAASVAETEAAAQREKQKSTLALQEVIAGLADKGLSVRIMEGDDGRLIISVTKPTVTDAEIRKVVEATDD